MKRAIAKWALALGWAALTAACWAQEQPLSVAGRVYTGFFSTVSRNGNQSSVRFVPAGLDLSLAGYLGSPGLLQYKVEPRLTSGPQASEVGLMGGNGVSLSTTFLGGRAFPLKLSYTNLRREDVFFGGIAQVSGFRSRNHERSLGLGWELRARGLPEVFVDYSTSALDATPDVAVLPDYRSKNRNAGVGVKEEAWGWQFTGEARRTKLANTFAAASDLRLIRLDQENSVAQAGATRALWAGSRLTLNGGVTRYESGLDGRPQKQSHRFSTASLTLGEGSRLQADLRSSYTSNLLGRQIERLLSGSDAGFGPEVVLLLPLSARIAHLSNSGGARVEVLPGWNIFASANQDRVRAPETGFTAPNSDYLSGTGGMSVNRQIAWLNLGAQYAGTLGHTTYRGLRGRLDGQNFSFSARSGRLERLEASGAYSQYRQRTRQALHTEGGGRAVTLSLGRRLGWLGLDVRAGGGYDRSYFQDENQRYRARGLSFHGSLQHRLAQAAYARNAADGKLLLGLLAGPAQSALLLGNPLAAVLSTFRTDTLTLHASPFSKLEFNLLWTRSRQAYAGQLTNRFEQFDVSTGYRFRLLTLDGGYVVYTQTLLGILPYHRDRFYVRVSRNFRVL